MLLGSSELTTLIYKGITTPHAVVVVVAESRLESTLWKTNGKGSLLSAHTPVCGDGGVERGAPP
jgi:hypothetical protein